MYNKPQQMFGIVAEMLHLHPSADASHKLVFKNSSFLCLCSGTSQSETLASTASMNDYQKFYNAKHTGPFVFHYQELM